MKIRPYVVALATLITLAGTSEAKILASGPLYSANGPAGGQFVCRIFNAGLASVSMSLRQIITNTNVVLPLISDTCNVALAPGRYCQLVATIPAGNVGFSCRTFVVGTDTEVRGVASVVNGATVLQSTPLQ